MRWRENAKSPSSSPVNAAHKSRKRRPGAPSPRAPPGLMPSMIHPTCACPEGLSTTHEGTGTRPTAMAHMTAATASDESISTGTTQKKCADGCGVKNGEEAIWSRDRPTGRPAFVADVGMSLPAKRGIVVRGSGAGPHHAAGGSNGGTMLIRLSGRGRSTSGKSALAAGTAGATFYARMRTKHTMHQSEYAGQRRLCALGAILSASKMQVEVRNRAAGGPQPEASGDARQAWAGNAGAATGPAHGAAAGRAAARPADTLILRAIVLAPESRKRRAFSGNIRHPRNDRETGPSEDRR